MNGLTRKRKKNKSIEIKNGGRKNQKQKRFNNTITYFI